MDEEKIIAWIEQRLNLFADFLLYNCVHAGIKAYYGDFPTIDNYNCNTEYIKCNVVNHKIHGPVYGNFVKSGQILKCNFDNGQLRGALEVSWPRAYMGQQVVSHTETHVEGIFADDLSFTGTCVRKGTFCGEKHYVKDKLIYWCGKWVCLAVADTSLGDICLYYTPDGKIDFSRSWQTDAQGRDIGLPASDITVYKLCKAPSRDGIVYCYVKLFVPADVKRIPFIPCATKTRVEKALVLDIFDGAGNKYDRAKSLVQDVAFWYDNGKWAVPDSFDDNETKDCSNGIHVHKYIDYCDQWKHLY